MTKYVGMMVLIVMLTALVGCGEKQSKDSEANAGVKEITYWHYVSDRKDFMNETAKQFEEETGIKVNVQLYGGDAFSSKIQSAVQGDGLPNVWMFVGGKADMSTFAVNQYIADLTSEAAMFERFDKQAMEKVSFSEDDPYETKSGIYGVPLDMNNMQIIYSKELFKQAGLDENNPPKTWDEFIEAGKKLNDAGITPFTSGFGSWTHGTFTEQYQFSYNSIEELTMVRNAEKTFAEGHFEDVFGLIEDMYKNQMFMRGIATMDLPTAEAAFANGQVAMLYDGSWVINVLKDLNPNFKSEDFGVMQPPVAKGTTNNTLIAGGVGAWLVASGKQSSAELEASIKFMEFITNKENQIKYANESSNIPANTEAIDPSSLDSLLADFYDGMQYVQPSIVGFTPKEISDTHGKLIQAVVIGEKSAEQAVQELDKVRESLMK